MSQAPARAWWAEVEHLREAAERRRAVTSGESPVELARARDAHARDEQRTRDRSSVRSPAQRRTVKIRGQVIPTAPSRTLHEATDAELDGVILDGPWPRPQAPSSTRRRPRRPAGERVGHRPDRIALWAFIAGLLLVVIAAATAHGAPLPAPAHAHAALGAAAQLSTP